MHKTVEKKNSTSSHIHLCMREIKVMLLFEATPCPITRYKLTVSKPPLCQGQKQADVFQMHFYKHYDT